MKVPKKLFVIAGVLLFLGGASTVLALQPEPKAKDISVKQVSAVSQPTQKASEEASAPAVAQQAAASEPVTTPTPEEPKYGQDPSNSGQFIILDKDWLLDSAGITDPVEITYATDALTKMSGGSGRWVYKSNGAPTLCSTVSQVYFANTVQIALDDPVEQLKSCRDLLGKYNNGSYANKNIATRWQILAGSVTN